MTKVNISFVLMVAPDIIDQTRSYLIFFLSIPFSISVSLFSHKKQHRTKSSSFEIMAIVDYTTEYIGPLSPAITLFFIAKKKQKKNSTSTFYIPADFIIIIIICCKPFSRYSHHAHLFVRLASSRNSRVPQWPDYWINVDESRCDRHWQRNSRDGFDRSNTSSIL